MIGFWPRSDIKADLSYDPHQYGVSAEPVWRVSQEVSHLVFDDMNSTACGIFASQLWKGGKSERQCWVCQWFDAKGALL